MHIESRDNSDFSHLVDVGMGYGAEMTRQDKDPWAFELAWEKCVSAGTYPEEAKEWAFLGWQAARDLYVPTATEKEAVEIALFALGTERSAQCGEPW